MWLSYLRLTVTILSSHTDTGLPRLKLIQTVECAHLESLEARRIISYIIILRIRWVCSESKKGVISKSYPYELENKEVTGLFNLATDI